MVLLIDNYDSFTWNLVQAPASLGAEVCVQRNDALDVPALLSLRASAVVLSPGPGRPEAAGVCPELLRQLPDSRPLLGVCLGHQALVPHYGGRIEVDPVPHPESILTPEGIRLLAAFLELSDEAQAARSSGGQAQ
ncbi:MAG: hypothetical protein ABIP42_02070 [Planctomycetota bacterium]